MITKGPGLAALPWVPSLIPGDFSRQILFPIWLVVLCSQLLHGDPWATGNDLRGGGVSLGMFPLGCCELGQALGSSAAPPISHTLIELFPQEFPITELTTAQGKAPMAPISTGYRCPWQE